MAILSGCQGKPQLKIMDKTCPNCGAEIEMFSIDTQARCEKCGFVVYNDALNCVQWCKYAKKCVGEDMFEQMKRLETQQKTVAAAQRKAEQISSDPPAEN